MKQDVRLKFSEVFIGFGTRWGAWNDDCTSILEGHRNWTPIDSKKPPEPRHEAARLRVQKHL